MAKFSEWKWEDHLSTNEDISGFLEETMALDDPQALIGALGVVARVKGMKEVSDETGLNEKSLYRALAEEGNPRFSTLTKVLDSLGLKLAIVPKEVDKDSAA